MWHTLLNYLYLHREAVLQLAGGAAGISIVLEGLLFKLKNKWHVDSKRLSYTLLNVFTGATALLAPFLTNMPMDHAPAVYAALALTAQTWHRFVISPAYSKWVVPFLEYQASTKVQTGNQVQPQLLDPSGSVDPEQFLGQ